MKIFGSKSEEILEYQSLFESNARTYPRNNPIVLKSGKGVKVKDIEGNVFIDCLAGAGVFATGHNHPKIVEAIKKFIDEGSILSTLDITTPIKDSFTRKLLESFPDSFKKEAKVQFCGPTGADAVEAALKLVKTYTGASTIISFHGAYHGMTHATLALTGSLKAKEKVNGLMPDVHFMPFPYKYRCPFGIGGEGCVDTSLNYIESVLKDCKSGIKKPAAVIVESVQGEGGSIPAPKRWLKGLREITLELDIPLIMDEIQTGFARTGYMFGFEAAGITPDLVVVSKAAGGGFPFSAVVYNKKYDLWEPGAHAGTFRGNQIAMATGIATMDLIKEENLIEKARQNGNYFLNKLKELQKYFPEIGEVRGRGLIMGIEIVDFKKGKDLIGSHPYAPELAKSIKKECLKNGLIIETGGRFDSVLRLLPPLIISKEEIDEVIEILRKSFKNCH